MHLIIGLVAFAAAPATASPGVTMMGALGLNTVPSARMDPAGTARANAAILDPYLHASAGIQIAAPLHIAVRQTALSSSVNGSADRLFPGIDLRLRLWDESAYIPAAVLGLQSALGHRRMAAEYLTFSKRHNDFDFTAGMAWGRLGSAAHIENPLKILHSHFGKRRLPDSEEPASPGEWFTGPDVGFFAGIAYAVPAIDGLTLKADWGADRYIAERAIEGFDAPAPWSIGFSYRPFDRVNVGAALIGGEKLMGRLTFEGPVDSWLGRAYPRIRPPMMRPYRTGLALPQEMARAAERDDIRLYDPQHELYSAGAQLLLAPGQPTALQIGRAARHMANHAGETTEELRITALSCGLNGPEIGLQRRDLEAALAWNSGSPQEIWRNVTFRATPQSGGLLAGRFDIAEEPLLRLVLDNQISLSEEDSGLLYRTGLLIEEQQRLSSHFFIGGALRLDIADNLRRLDEFRPRAVLPVRSNVDDFARRTLSVERSYLGWMKTVKPDLHVGVTGGYLEEMYAGAGGEILYRPFGKRFSIGAQAYQVFKREPDSDLELGFNGDRLLTGHVDFWYEVPDSDLTIQARFGRYLAEDIGGTLALRRDFNNGASVEAFATATNSADFDIFGSTTHLYSGLKLRLPLGNLPPVPAASEIRLTAAPLGRDSGQSLDAPLGLYALSEPLSKRHLTRHWNMIAE